MDALNPELQQILVIAVVAVIVLVLVIDLALAAAWLWTRDAVLEGRRAALFAPSWSLIDPWFGGQAAGALTLWLILLLMIAGTPFVDGVGTNSGMPIGFAVLALTIQNIAMVAVTYAYVRWRYRLSLDDIGLHWPPTRSQIRTGILLGIGLLIIGGLAEAGVKAVGDAMLPAHVKTAIERLSGAMSAGGLLADARPSPLAFLGLAFAASIAAPVGEEVFFRGFLHNCTRRRFGPGLGTLLSAGCFAAVHGGPLMILAILPMGIILAWAYDRTGSLWVPILMHGFNNGVLSIVVALNPGMAR